MYWLMKSEPGECSFEYVCGLPEHKVSWWGIRNYQARNFMRDKMTVGDGVLFYHSSCAEPGIAGIAEIASETYPDSLQFDPASEYFDAKSTHEKPRWLALDVKAVTRIDPIPLSVSRATPELEGMLVLSRGNRLSITPVEEHHWRYIMDLLVKNARNVA